MTVLQSTYTDTIALGYPGLIANGEQGNRISRTCETAAGIGFGKAVYRGSGDHGCLLAQTLTGAGAVVAGNTGTTTITASPTVGAGAKIGVYKITQIVTGATGAITVEDPDGYTVARGVVGTAITTIPGITSVTLAGTGTPTAGDQWTITVTGNAFLGIAIATSALGYIAGQDADEYQQYDAVNILTGGTPIWVTAGGTVNDGDPVSVDSSGNFVTGSGVPLAGWVFDTTGASTGLVKIVKR
jgi:hypothetical protein